MFWQLNNSHQTEGNRIQTKSINTSIFSHTLSVLVVQVQKLILWKDKTLKLNFIYICAVGPSGLSEHFCSGKICDLLSHKYESCLSH